MELALSSTETAVLRNERALVEAARRGDDRAFEQLYAMYRDRVGAFILSKVRDHGRAEDISQEVFMSALRQLRSNGQEIAFKPWVFAIAKNACIDEFRRTARGREVPVEAGEDFPTDQRASLSIVPSPPSAIESKQRLEDLRGAFGGLSESHHRLLVMRELEGRSYDEIGNRLGMTRQMVESGLFRARRKLSGEYDELASGRRCEQVQTVIERGAALKLKALGIKERRRLTQHLSHCQPCRHQARMAGVDPSLLKPRSIAAKIAAMLPFGGFWRWRPWRGGGSSAAGAHASGHAASGAAQGVAQAAGTAGSSITLGQAAAAAAALAIASAGGGFAIAQHSDHGHRPPPVKHHVSTTGHAGSAAGARLAPAVVPASGHGVSAQGARAGAARSHAHGARAAAKRSATGPKTLGSGTKRHTTAKSPNSGQSHTTPTGGSGASTSSPSTQNPISSSGSQAKNLLNTTINRTGQTVGKVTDPVKKIVAPIQKATDPVTAPVKKVVAPVTKVVPPVTKVVPPVPGPPSSGANGSGGSAGSSEPPDPVGTVKKVVSGL
jgi:RNA polymerase sigma factor (sigma-70 family)